MIQQHSSDVVMQIYRKKLEAKGFKVDGDYALPPVGMGHFACQEIAERLFKESIEESNKLRIV